MYHHCLDTTHNMFLYMYPDRKAGVAYSREVNMFSPGNSRTRVLVCGLGVFVCALHGVSPRDRWLCVLPGWQMNVNVNTMVHSRFFVARRFARYMYSL